MRELKFQQKAVRRLVDMTTDLLRLSGSRQTLIFKAPTGSGKTVMAASFALANLTITFPIRGKGFLLPAPSSHPNSKVIWAILLTNMGHITDQYGPYYRPIWAILLFHKTYKSHKLHKHCKPTATLLTQAEGAQERLFAG